MAITAGDYLLLFHARANVLPRQTQTNKSRRFQHVSRGQALKEKMTSFDIAAITPELNHVMQRCYVDNIYHIPPRTLLLRLRQPGEPRLHLLIEAGKRLHLTSYILEKPSRPSSFCMALRKHLRNGVITEIGQHRFERIVTLKVNTKEGAFQLVSELFNKGNIILVSPQNVILQALSYRRMRDRNILRGEVFQQAPSSGTNPLELNRQDLDEMKKFGKLEIVRALTKFLSIGGLYAEEILLRTNVNKDVSCASLTESEMDRIFDQLSPILSTIRAGKVDPQVIIDDKGDLIDVTPLPLKKYAHLKQKPYETFNAALDDYYTETTTKQRATKVAKEDDRRLAKQRRILQKQSSTLEDLKAKIERNQEIGNAIYMHLNNLLFLVQRIKEEKKGGKAWEEIASTIKKEKAAGTAPAIYFQSLEPEPRVLNVSIGDLTFPLSLRRSVQSNATIYYNRSKKAEKKLEGAKKALQETQVRIEKLQEKQAEKERETRAPPQKRRRKAWYEKFRWFHSSDGFLVIGGRDATTNEILIKKHMEPHDIVFHADIRGAPFVLIKTEGKTPPEPTLGEAAQLAASYSRAWKDMFTALDVYWVSPQQVDKSPPSGQYLKKGSFRIHGSKNYARNVSLKVAIGAKSEEEHLVIVSGPPQAISKQTETYVEVVPGEQKSGQLAKRIRRRLAEKAPKTLGEQLREVPVEEIQRSVPLGKGRIL